MYPLFSMFKTLVTSWRTKITDGAYKYMDMLHKIYENIITNQYKGTRCIHLHPPLAFPVVTKWRSLDRKHLVVYKRWFPSTYLAIIDVEVTYTIIIL